MKHRKHHWHAILADALLCGGAVCIVAGVTLMAGACQALIVAGAFSICYGILAAQSEQGGGA